MPDNTLKLEDQVRDISDTLSFEAALHQQDSLLAHEFHRYALSSASDSDVAELLHNESQCGLESPQIRTWFSPCSRFLAVARTCDQHVRIMVSEHFHLRESFILRAPANIESVALVATGYALTIAALLSNRKAMISVTRIRQRARPFKKQRCDSSKDSSVSMIHIRSPRQDVRLFNAGFDRHSSPRQHGLPTASTFHVPPLPSVQRALLAPESLDRPRVTRRHDGDVKSQRRPSVTGFKDMTTTFEASPNNSDEMDVQQTVTTAMYEDLCSASDPPLSIAINPLQHAVAFGCKGGVEIHWQDSRHGGRNLMKWFPLTEPSEVLYFMPVVQWHNRFRVKLISSLQDKTLAPFDDSTDSSDEAPQPSIWTTLRSWAWQGDEFQSQNERVDRRMADHYHAIPLSDGFHLLCVEPITKQLFLGRDAAQGAAAKMTRVVQFDFPIQDGTREILPIPRIYAASSDLSWGIRVVAVYEETIVLYTIPTGVYADLASGKVDSEWQIYWPSWIGQPCHAQGVTIGRAAGVTAVAVQSDCRRVTVKAATEQEVLVWQMRLP